MRLYLEEKEDTGIERDPDNNRSYLEVSIFSFMKCSMGASFLMGAISAGVVIILSILFGLLG